jgi:hypothetical protein
MKLRCKQAGFALVDPSLSAGEGRCEQPRIRGACSGLCPLLGAKELAPERPQLAGGNVNLDLGAALLDQLASVDPASMDVAGFYCYGLLGPDTPSYLGTGDHVARTIAANGIRLVLDEHRTTETPTLKSGQPGKTKVSYGKPEDAVRWLWRFVLCRAAGYAEAQRGGPRCAC